MGRMKCRPMRRSGRRRWRWMSEIEMVVVLVMNRVVSGQMDSISRKRSRFSSKVCPLASMRIWAAFRSWRFVVVLMRFRMAFLSPVVSPQRLISLSMASSMPATPPRSQLSCSSHRITSILAWATFCAIPCATWPHPNTPMVVILMNASLEMNQVKDAAGRAPGPRSADLDSECPLDFAVAALVERGLGVEVVTAPADVTELEDV